MLFLGDSSLELEQTVYNVYYVFETNLSIFDIRKSCQTVLVTTTKYEAKGTSISETSINIHLDCRLFSRFHQDSILLSKR